MSTADRLRAKAAGRRVLVRDPNCTEMRVSSDGEAKAFAKQLIRARKGFEAAPNDDGTWTVIVYEQNEPSRWEWA